jgi:hypothetical protein
MVRRDTDVGVTRLDDLEHSLENADHRAILTVHAFIESAEPVKMTEQLVGPVDQVNDQYARLLISFVNRR